MTTPALSRLRHYRHRRRHEVATERRSLPNHEPFNGRSIRLLPGEFYATGAQDEMIVTVLGSCVAACIRNPYTGYGGMNHFMLPESESGDWNGASAALRYGNHAMEALISTVLRSGCSRRDLEIKLFGGANLTVGPAMIGEMNAIFALRYTADEGLNIGAADLGGTLGRRIHYVPATGAVRRVFLVHGRDRSVLQNERDYASTLDRMPVEGSIELFD